jgi:hypothetical protein
MRPVSGVDSDPGLRHKLFQLRGGLLIHAYPLSTYRQLYAVLFKNHAASAQPAQFPQPLPDAPALDEP